MIQEENLKEKALSALTKILQKNSRGLKELEKLSKNDLRDRSLQSRNSVNFANFFIYFQENYGIALVVLVMRFPRILVKEKIYNSFNFAPTEGYLPSVVADA